MDLLSVETAGSLSRSFSCLSSAQGIFDCCKESATIEWLAKKCACVLSAVLVCDFMAASNKKHRHFWPLLFHSVTKFKAVHARHPDVGDKKIYVE